MSIQVCRDTSDAVALYLPQRLYLKSFARINISVQLPPQKVHGKSISNWEVMEKLRKMIQPETFSMLKVSKHSSEVIRFDAELENRDKLDRVLARLEDRVIQLNNYPDPLKVKVCEAKSDYPSRHSWDSFFRDATDMDEMKPGERPDTVHVANLPIRWFVHDRERHEDAPPSETIFKKVFEKFGSIRQIDVPAADPFRMQMKTSMRGITVPVQDSALYFEGYIQFSEYVGFVRCMDALRGKKLVRKKEDLAEWCWMAVDFDKTKHMTDAAFKRRSIVRERLLTRQRAKEEEERLQKEKIAKQEARERQKQEHVDRMKLEGMREREERRKKKQLAKLMERDNVDLNRAVGEEENKLLKAQKKLQSLRVMEELFSRIELRSNSKHNGTGRFYRGGDEAARSRIIERMKKELEKAVDTQRDRLRQAIDGRIVIRSALETKKPRTRASSISSLSSNDEQTNKRIKTEKLNTPEREIEYKKALGMYGMPPYGFGYPFSCPPAAPYPYPQTSLYYGGYYPPPADYAPRRPFRGRGRGGRGGRGRGADSHYHGRYMNNGAETRNEHDDKRQRTYSRSRSRSRSRRRRSYSRSRSRSRSRRSRSHSRRRSRSRHSRTRSRSHRRSRSRSRRSRSRSRSKSKPHTPEHTHKEGQTERQSVDSSKFVSPKTMRQQRSKSWSLPREPEKAKSWSKSPKDK